MTTTDPPPIFCPHCCQQITFRSLVGGACGECGVELDDDDVEVILADVR